MRRRAKVFRTSFPEEKWCLIATYRCLLAGSPWTRQNATPGHIPLSALASIARLVSANLPRWTTLIEQDAFQGMVAALRRAVPPLKSTGRGNDIFTVLAHSCQEP